jgi:hypothetical protein
MTPRYHQVVMGFSNGTTTDGQPNTLYAKIGVHLQLLPVKIGYNNFSEVYSSRW